MSEWLGQVPLRSRGLMLGAPQDRLGAFLGVARLLPSYELGRPVRYQLGETLCCNAPDGKGYCFDSGTGECVATWVSASGGPAGSPACIKDSRGRWVHPSCPSQPNSPEVVAAAQQGATCPEGQVMVEGQCASGAIACPSGTNYDLLEVNADGQPTGRILGRGIPYQRVQSIPGINIVNASDPRCTTQSPVSRPASQPSAQTVTERPSDGFTDSVPASHAPVLPQRAPTTRAALPTGAGYGSPFQVSPAPKPVLVAQSPLPIPDPCPLGPVPMADWVYGCMGIEQT